MDSSGSRGDLQVNAIGMNTPPDELRPLGAGGDRIVSMDFVRGIAVLGILAANMMAFGQPMLAAMWPGASLVPHDRADDIAYAIQFVLIDGKMRGLFAILFGAGMVLFLERARAAGPGDVLQVRRLAWLLLIGLAHYFLLWRGDILAAYAVCGLLALPCVDWRARSLMIVALAIYLLSAIFLSFTFGGLYMVAETPFGLSSEMAETRALLATGEREAMEDALLEGRLIASGAYGAFVGHNFSVHAGEWGMATLIVAFEIVPLILIGMALYKIGIFDGRANPNRQKIWGWVGVIAGAGLSVPIALWVVEEGLSYYGTSFAAGALGSIARLPMTLGLAALLALWGGHASGWLAVRFSAAGRMAFSNYLGTTILMVLLFHGWALGLFGELGRLELYLVMLGVWALILAWSKPWLDRFRFGPLEWAWRCLTYWKLFPLARR